MTNQIDRAKSLFPATVNLKWFLGHRRGVTGAELADQLLRADAQVREGLAMPTPHLDGDLTVQPVK